MKQLIARIDRLPLAPISAALLGAAAAFFTVAMPSPLLEGVVGAAGIAQILPAAQAPLGDTARALVAMFAAFGAAATGGGVVLLAGRSTSRPKPAYADEQWHDDLFGAGPVEGAKLLSPTRDLHGVALPHEAPLGGPRFAEVEMPLVPQAAIVAEPEPLDLVDFLDPAAAEPPPQAQVQSTVIGDPFKAAPPLSAPASHIVPAKLSTEAPVVDDSISALMARFEAGVIRRDLDRSASPIPSSAAKPAMPPPADPVAGTALDAALRDLKRLAAG